MPKFETILIVFEDSKGHIKFCCVGHHNINNIVRHQNKRTMERKTTADEHTNSTLEVQQQVEGGDRTSTTETFDNNNNKKCLTLSPGTYLGGCLCLVVVVGCILAGVFVSQDRKNDAERAEREALYYAPSTGPIPSNNRCRNATLLNVIDNDIGTINNITNSSSEGGVFIAMGDNVGSTGKITIAEDDSRCTYARDFWTFNTASGVWYTFDVDQNDTYVVSTCQTTFDSYIGVYEGSCGDDDDNLWKDDIDSNGNNNTEWNCVASVEDCYDGSIFGDYESCDSYANGNSAVVVEGVEGRSYYIYIQGFIGTRGSFGVKVERGFNNPCSCSL